MGGILQDRKQAERGIAVWAVRRDRTDGRTAMAKESGPIARLIGRRHSTGGGGMHHSGEKGELRLIKRCVDSKLTQCRNTVSGNCMRNVGDLRM